MTPETIDHIAHAYLADDDNERPPSILDVEEWQGEEGWILEIDAVEAVFERVCSILSEPTRALDNFMFSTVKRIGRTYNDTVSPRWETEIFQLRQETVDAFRDLVDILKK